MESLLRGSARTADEISDEVDSRSASVAIGCDISIIHPVVNGFYEATLNIYTILPT